MIMVRLMEHAEAELDTARTAANAAAESLQVNVTHCAGLSRISKKNAFVLVAVLQFGPVNFSVPMW